MIPFVKDQISAIFWAMVPGFNVYAKTKLSFVAGASDSSNTWKQAFLGTDGPYILNGLTWYSSSSPYSFFGIDVRVTANGSVFNFSWGAANHVDIDTEENMLPFPIIAKSELKIEMKKGGSNTNKAYLTARIDRIVTQ